MPGRTKILSLDPFLASRLHLIAGLDHSASRDQESMRKLIAFAEDPTPWCAPDSVSWSHAEVAGPHGPVALRIYRPVQTDIDPGVFVWAHGGGFLAGDLDMNEAHMVGLEIARRSSRLVVSVGYRLAVDNTRFPVPLDEVAAVWRWVRSELADPAAPAHLGGASAGAALALATALRMRDEGGPMPSGLVLAYPFIHFPIPAPSDEVVAELMRLPPVMRFSASDVDFLVRNYVGRLSGLPPLAMPGSSLVDGLMPTTILVSEIDDLRASGELFHRQLSEAGIPSTLHVCAGMPHGHLNRTPTLAEVDRSLDLIASALLA